jgi:hypothetical protein
VDKLSGALSQTLRDSDLHAISADLGEAVLDTLFEDGFAKNIPILGTVYKLCTVGLKISDRLFARKLVYFLAEVASVPAAERAKMISNIESSGKYRLKVGEKLLYVLEKADDHEVARVIAILFSAVLSGELDYGDFLRGCRAVQGLAPVDLELFVNDERDRWSVYEPVAGALLAAGLLEFDELEIRVEDEWDPDMARKYRVDGGEISGSVTKVGKALRAVLRSRWSAGAQDIAGAV